MTFQKEFSSILKKNHITVNDIASLLGYKSRNSVYRLISCEGNIEKTVEFIEVLREKKLLSLSEENWEALIQTAKKETQNNIKKRIFNPLMALYTKRSAKHFYLNSDNKKTALNDLLSLHKSGNIKIFFSSYSDEALVNDIYTLLETNENSEVYHFVNFNGGEVHIANELAAILRLSKFQNYLPYCGNKSDFHGIVVLIEDNEDYFTVLSEKRYNYENCVATSITKEMYTFLSKNYNAHLSKCKPMKNVKNNFIDIVELLQQFSVTEMFNSVSLEGGICMAQLDENILLRLLKDINNFGLPIDSQYLKKLLDAITARAKMRKASERKLCYILSKNKITEFLKTKRVHDHPKFAGTLTKQEVENTLDWLNTAKNVTYRFLKYNIKYDIFYTEGYGIYTYDSALSYGKNHYDLIITDKRAIQVFKEFTDYLFCEHTLNEDESKQLLSRLKNQYLD